MIEQLDHLGRLGFVCVPCERTRARLCRDCESSTPKPRAIRCTPCERVHTAKGKRDWKAAARRDDKKRALLNTARRRNYRTNAASRARILTSIAEYQKAHPRVRDDVTRLVEKMRKRNDRADPIKNKRINASRRKNKELKKQHQQAAA